MKCRDCARAVDHCHGTLIVHASNAVECTEGNCAELQSVRHVFVVDCSAVAGGCECVDGPDRILLAS
ncbi:hypothetical protein [Rhodococcoides trifolii]|nr:hypothetical protein [Rhodococcus trifolii]